MSSHTAEQSLHVNYSYNPTHTITKITALARKYA